MAYSSPSSSGLCRDPGWYQRATSMASESTALDHLPEAALDRLPHRRDGPEVRRLQGGQFVLGHSRRGVVMRVPGRERGDGHLQLHDRIARAG